MEKYVPELGVTADFGGSIAGTVDQLDQLIAVIHAGTSNRSTSTLATVDAVIASFDVISVPSTSGDISQVSGGIWLLKAGGSYKLTADLGPYGSGPVTPAWKFHDGTNYVGAHGGMLVQDGQNYGVNMAAVWHTGILTADLTVELRTFKADADVTGLSSGSKVIIEKIPTSILPTILPTTALAHGRMELTSNQSIAANIESITMTTSTGGVGVYPFDAVTIQDGGMTVTSAGFVDNDAASQNPDGTNTTSSMVVPNDGKYEVTIAAPSALDSTIEADDRPLAAIFVNGAIHKVFNIHDLAYDASSADQDKFVRDTLTLNAGDLVYAGYRIEGGGAEAWGYREPLETTTTVDVTYSFFEIRQLTMASVITVPSDIIQNVLALTGTVDLDATLADAPVNFSYPFQTVTGGATVTTGNGMERIIDGDLTFGPGSQSQVIPEGVMGHVFKQANDSVGVHYITPPVQHHTVGTEHDTGEDWVDGDRIYRQSFDVDLQSFTTGDALLTGVKKLINVWGVAWKGQFNSANQNWPQEGNPLNATNHNYVIPSGTDVQLHFTANQAGGGPPSPNNEMTLWYTKV